MTKRGFSEKCKVSEKIFNEGKAEGRTEKRATVRNLFKLGIPVETIFKAVEVNIKLVQEWISGNENGNMSPAR